MRYRSTVRGLVVRALAVSAALLLTLLLLEIGLRAAGWSRDFERLERIEEGTLRQVGVSTLHANTVIAHSRAEFDVEYRTNSWGYFDREWSVEKDARVVRVALLGDSFTMGHGVRSDQTFPRLLQELLTQHAGESVETLNMGVWGTGTLQQIEFLDDALALEADHVVFCFYLNDIFDNQRYKNRPPEELKQILRPRSPIGRMSRSLRNVCNQTSRLCAFVLSRTRGVRAVMGWTTKPMESVFAGESNNLLLEASGYLNETATELRKAGVPMTVVYIPLQVQVVDGSLGGRVDLNLPNSLLRENLEGLRFIDLTPDFREGGKTDLWYDEGHLQSGGHAFVAERLARRMLERGGLTARPGGGGDRPRPQGAGQAR
jgi:lysophospholipase L1-like esterase